jgi:hypothetical protein
MVAALAFLAVTAIDFSFYGQVSDCVNQRQCDRIIRVTGWNRCPSNNLKGRPKTFMATKTVTVQDIQKQFKQAGFGVSTAPGDRIEVKKSGFVAYLGRESGKVVYIEPPYFIFQGLQCELEDRGYQKFWFAKAENKRFPIRKSDLLVLHGFDEEVRFILGMTSLYNESLGSTNARTVYDRLTGRADR